MASTLILKNGTGSAVPSTLIHGEPAINVSTGLFYFGSGSGGGATVKTLSNFTHITASGNISSSGNITGKIGYFSDNNGIYTDKIRRFSDSSTTTLIKLNDEHIKIFAGSNTAETIGVQNQAVKISGSLNVESPTGGHITATGNISASGNIIGANVFLPGGGKISFDNSLDGSDQFIAGNDNNITIDADNILKIRADQTIQFQDTSNNAQVTIDPIAGHITASGNVKAAQLRIEEVNTLPIAITGGLVYSASAFYMGL